MFERWPKLTAILAILATLAAVSFLIRHTVQGSRRPEGTVWFYDLKTRKLFPASDVSVPPIDTKSGPGMGVRAYVYVPEDPPDSTNRFIAFLETLTPDTKREVEAEQAKTGRRAPVGFALEKRMGGILVSSPDELVWYPKFSQEGYDLMEAGKLKGGTDRIRPSLP